jgi:hypothetical protein
MKLKLLVYVIIYFLIYWGVTKLVIHLGLRLDYHNPYSIISGLVFLHWFGYMYIVLSKERNNKIWFSFLTLFMFGFMAYSTINVWC